MKRQTFILILILSLFAGKVVGQCLVITNPAAACSPATVDLTAAAVTAGSAASTFTYWTDAGATSPYATPATATAGTYYIKGEGGTGCPDVKPVTVTVNPLTGATIFTAGATELCKDSPDETYTATAANSTSIGYSVLPVSAGTIDANTGVMSWSNGFAGTATITATSTGLCGITTADRVVTVYPNNPGTPGTITGTTSVCQGQTGVAYSISAVTNATNYVWTVPAGGTITSGTGTTSITVDFAAGASDLTISVYAENVCGSGSARNLSVTVHPTPTVTNSTTASTCSGTSPNITLTASPASTFVWTIGAITGSITGASGGSGGTINQILTNPSNTLAGTVQYLVTPTSTAGSCVGSAFTITVTVNPAPAVTNSATASICSGTGTNITLTSSIPGSFTWTIGIITGEITGASAGSGGTINQTLTNPSNSAAGTVPYLVIPTSTANSCVGSAFTITVTVDPKPAVTNLPTASACNGTGPNITLTSSVPSTFAWTIGTITGGITGASGGSGGTINQTLTNPSTTTAGTVEYLVTPTPLSGSCVVGSTRTITVTVNPLPTLTGAAQAATICEGSSAAINLLGLVAGTTSTVSYSINGAVQTPVPGVVANGSGAASFNTAILTAASNGQILRITGITTTSTNPNCTYVFTQDVTLSVNPLTVGGTIASDQTICSGSSPANLILSGNTGSVVKWQKSSNPGFTTPIDIAGTSTTLTGSTIGPLTSNTYFRAIVKSGTCLEVYSATILVTVNPLPVPTISGPSSVLEGSSGNVYTTQTGMTAYTWVVSSGGIITAGSGTNTITVTWNSPGAKTVNVNYTNVNNCTAATASVYNVTVNAKPVAGNVSILGNPRSGLTLNASYVYSDADGDPEGASVYQWYTGTSAGGAGSSPIPSASSLTYKLTDAELGKFIGFSVTPVAQVGATPGNMVTTSVWVGIVDNSPPVAAIGAITGSLNAGSAITGHYTYSDLEGDIESLSSYQWYSASSSGGTYFAITGETNITHVIGLTEEGKYFKFYVIPKAGTGAITGIEVSSAWYGPVNTRPSATGVGISGTVAIGNTLTGNYVYNDIDGDAEGISTFRWFRNGVEIPGSNSVTYTIVSTDEAYKLSFQVTPVSTTGHPDTGLPVTSSETIAVPLTGTLPVVSDVCIDGKREAGNVIRGKYVFIYNPSNDYSVYRWMRDNDTIAGATSITYTLTAADIDHDIYFIIYPYSALPAHKRGITVKSNPLARITLTKTSYSLADEPVALTANIGGGIFSGPGVTNGNFSPANAGIIGSPHIASYLLNIVNATTTCSQQANVQIIVVPIIASFVGLKNVYCFDGPRDTITVANVPLTATNLKFRSSNMASIVDSIPPYKIVIDPGRKRPGIFIDTLYFSYRNEGSYFPILKTLETDSVGQALIKNINSGDVFCNNATPFTLYPSPAGTGGVFTGPVTGALFDPSKGMGDTLIKYTYTNSRTGCFSTVEVPIRINASPVVSFKPVDICVVSSADTIRFNNMTTSSDTIAKWLWEFSDPGGSSTSGLMNPGYLYKTGGLHKVTLKATTIHDCSSIKDTTIDIGVKPKADFYWKNECYHPNDSIMLFDSTYSTSQIVSRSWNFFDGDSLHIVKNPIYPKKTTGYLSVEYIVKTNYSKCSDTITKNIYIRPAISLAADYFENFEGDNGGWVKDYEIRNNWSFGTPDRTNINMAASGNNAWFTKYSLTDQKAESSSIISPCFDFDTIRRPMISIKLWKRFDINRDGAALQYKIGDTEGWQYVGTLGDGINWYNSTLIKGRPGGDQIGWTAGAGNSKDATWIESRHKLDELVGKKDVKFRIAYGSDGTSQDNDGIAFDDIWIGRRTRGVLLEHFTNNSSSSAGTATTMVSDLANRDTVDIINIQYHTNFPGTDPYYDANPGDASARFLFYGLSRAPYSFIDGGTRKNYANIFDYLIADIDSNDLTRRSLISPSFSITLTSTVTGGILTVSGQIKALEAINSENITLYLAVTEKKNTAPGGTEYFNVFRKFIPDAGGISLSKTWSKEEPYTLSEKTWTIKNISNAADMEIIAFIQNNITKEIYQAESNLKHGIIVGIDNLFANNGKGFSLYPNPTGSRLTIAFEKAVENEADIRIYDFSGTLIRTYKTGSGQSEITIDNPGLTGGIYLVRVSSAGMDWGYKKLIVSEK